MILLLPLSKPHLKPQAHDNFSSEVYETNFDETKHTAWACSVLIALLQTVRQHNSTTSTAVQHHINMITDNRQTGLHIRTPGHDAFDRTIISDALLNVLL